MKFYVKLISKMVVTCQNLDNAGNKFAQHCFGRVESKENYELISSSQCIIFKKILAAKNTVFLVKLVPCRCRSQP